MNINNIHAQRSIDRAADAARRIAEDPSTVVLVRYGVAQAAQTVRAEPDNTVNRNADVSIDNMAKTRRGCVLFGTPSFNVQVGDVFGLWGDQFRVDSVIPQQGEIQARCIRFE